MLGTKRRSFLRRIEEKIKKIKTTPVYHYIELRPQADHRKLGKIKGIEV
jgi:hypothetical protein